MVMNKLIFFILILSITFFLILACEEPVFLNNPVDPGASDYIGYDIGDQDNDGVTDLFDIDTVSLRTPENNYQSFEDTLTFVWNPISTAVRFHLELARDSDFTDIITSINDLTENSFNTALQEHGTFYWRVRAGDEERWGDNWSETRITQQFQTRPTLIGPEDRTIIDDLTPALQWNIGTECDAYQMEISDSVDFSNGFLLTSEELTLQNYSIEQSLINGTTFFWHIRAKIEGDWYPWSESFQFTTALDIFVPLNPSVIGEIPNSKPEFSWDIPEGSNLFHIQISDNEDFSNFIVNDDSITVTNYTLDSPFEYGKDYYWRAKYLDIQGVWGDWSETWHFIVDYEAVTLNSPSNIEINNTHDIDFDWSIDNSDLLFDLEISNFQDFHEIVHSETGLEANTNQVTLGNGYYYWRVRPVDTYNTKGDWTEPVFFTVFYYSTELNEPETNDTSPVFKWEKINGEIDYNVQIATTQTFYTETVLVDQEFYQETSNTVSFSAPVLSDDTTYYWRLKWKDPSQTYGPWTNSFPITIDMGDVELISPEDGEGINILEGELQFSDISIAEEYKVEIYDNSALSGDPVFSDNIDIQYTEYTYIAFDPIRFETGYTRYPSYSYQIPADALETDAGTYYWHINYRNQDDVWSSSGIIRSFTPTLGTIQITYPANDSIIENNTLDINWQNIDEAEYYGLQISQNSDFDSPLIDESSITGNNNQVTLSNGTYFIRMNFSLQNGTKSPWSDINQINVECGFNPVSDATIFQRLPSFIWDDYENTQDYEFMIDNDEDFSSPEISKKGLMDSQYTITEEDNIEYGLNYWQVRAHYNNGGFSDWSNTRSFEFLRIYTFGGSENDEGNGVIKASSEELILVGYTESFGYGEKDAYYVKYNTETEQTIDTQTWGSVGNDYASAIDSNNGSDFYITGQYADSTMWLLRIDDSSNVSWEMTYSGNTAGMDIKAGQSGYLYVVDDNSLFQIDYDGTIINGNDFTLGGYQDHLYSITIAYDNKIVFGGYATPSGTSVRNFWIIGTDSSTNMEWMRNYDAGTWSYGPGIWSYGRDIIVCQDSGYIMTGYTHDDLHNKYYVHVMKFNQDGIREWQETYSEGKSYSILQTDDNSFLIGGNDNNDIILIKTDNNGTFEWKKTIGGPGTDSITQMIEYGPGYAIVGSTDSIGSGGYDMFLILVDENGNTW
jgi:hypothetical protein